MAEPYNNLDRENRNQTYNDNFIMSNDQNNQRYNGDYDIKSENSEENTLSVNYMMRLGFIRKVYSVLTFQLVLTVLIASIGFIDSVKNYYMNNWWPFWVSFGIMIVTCIAISCFKTAARTVPTNYILLFLFTASESIIISFLISAINDPKIIAIAAISTIVVTSVLTIYACTTKTDLGADLKPRNQSSNPA